MDSEKADKWWGELLDSQLELSRNLANEVRRLRKENNELRAIIASFPSTVSDLQDQVSLLECRLEIGMTPILLTGERTG
jgi:hypothetical protein